jgi:hypothetical protein
MTRHFLNGVFTTLSLAVALASIAMVRAAPRDKAAPQIKVAARTTPSHRLVSQPDVQASTAYRPSRVPGVQVRFIPTPSTNSGSGSVYVRPGATLPRTLPGVATARRPLIIHPLPGGGQGAHLDESWHAATRAVIVNGKVRLQCLDGTHGTTPHYHDASGRHNLASK